MQSFDVRYFASLREALGTGRERVSSAAGTVAELRLELAARGGAYAQALAPERRVRAAVNQDMADADAALAPGQVQEVAFFPPVTGG